MDAKDARRGARASPPTLLEGVAEGLSIGVRDMKSGAAVQLDRRQFALTRNGDFQKGR